MRVAAPVLWIFAACLAAEPLSTTEDELDAAFDPPVQVTAYTNAQARQFLNIGKGVAVDGTGVVHEAWLEVTRVISAANPAAVRGMVMYRRSTDNGTSWSTPMQLSPESDYTGYPKLAAFGTNVYVVFHAVYDSTTTTHPYLIRSIDSGAHFQPQQAIATGPATLPTVAAWGSSAFVVWAAPTSGVSEIFFSSSTDQGKTWSPTKQLTSSDGFSSWTPSIGVWGSRLVVAWTDERNDTADCAQSSNQSASCREELYAQISNDAGASWGSDLRLTNDGATPRSTWAPSVALWNNSIHIAYFDRQDDVHFQIYYLRSLDGGAHWDPTKRLSRDTTVLQAARPSLAVLADQLHLVYWQTRSNGIADVMYTASPTNGGCWSAPTAIATTTVPEEPHPSIAVSPNGCAFTTWFATVAGTGGTQLFATRRRPVAPVCN